MFGSWAEACRLTVADGQYHHAEFRRLYAALSKRAPETMAARLEGLHEIANRECGMLPACEVRRELRGMTEEEEQIAALAPSGEQGARPPGQSA